MIDHRMLTRDLFGDRYAFVTRLYARASVHARGLRSRRPGRFVRHPSSTSTNPRRPPAPRLPDCHGLQRRDPPDRHHQPVKHRFLLFIPGAVTNHDTVCPLFNGLHTAPEVERKAGLLINLKCGAGKKFSSTIPRKPGSASSIATGPQRR